MCPSAPQVLLILTAASSVLAQDTFLETARTACMRYGHILPCAKYKIANLVHRIASTQRSVDLGPMRLVSIPRGNTSQEESLMARAADFAPKEPELLKMFKYGVRQLDLFLNSHGISLPLAGFGSVGPYIVHDDGTSTNSVDERATGGEAQAEGRGRNLHLIVPLMIMVKLMSIKALLIPTLLGVAAIKKFIILTVMLLPSILHKLKACKIVPHLVHYTPHHTHSHEFHDDYLPHHEHHDLHDPHHEHHDHLGHHEAFHQGDIHRRLAHYRGINV